MNDTLRKIDVQRWKAKENILYFKTEMYAKLLILFLRLLVLIMVSMVLNMKIIYAVVLIGVIYLGYRMKCVYDEDMTLINDIKESFEIDDVMEIRINLNLKGLFKNFKGFKKEENYGK